LLDIVSPSLEPHVSVTVHLSNSVEWKLRNKIEWSVDMEAKFFIESLSLKLFGFVKIEYSPFLMGSSIVAPYSYSISFLIFASFNIKDLVVLTEVYESSILNSIVLEQLPPSRVGAPDLHVVGLS
jgi:hypothetical protein